MKAGEIVQFGNDVNFIHRDSKSKQNKKVIS
jgi:hypothetical protein